MRKRFFLYFIIVLGFVSLDFLNAMAANKMDLDDLKIQGELHGDGKLRLIGRKETQLRDFVKFRTNYRSEMIEDLPRPLPQVIYYGSDPVNKK